MLLFDESLEVGQIPLTKKELSVLRQTTRLAGIAVTFFSQADEESQELILKLLTLLVNQIVEIRIEKASSNSFTPIFTLGQLASGTETGDRLSQLYKAQSNLITLLLI